ncbi:TolC family protein [Sphingomonas parva]|uniref:TolC family protein n=1 Tax=Sphingomonas parva TaxID=2555898 RepID=A0A4Y8ZVF7_9SPHN|nr:TolC family protein [Sphingomonas parva]TFI58426.1 TolC family protein [Sphingomonas parva]
MTRTRSRARTLCSSAAITLAALASSGVMARALTLPEALARAEENSQLLRASQASVTAAEARARQAGVSPNPELEVEVENVLGTGPYSGFGGTELTVAVGQRFERGGKRNARRMLARAEVDLATATLARTRADLIRDVRTAFVDAVSTEERLALSRETVARAEELARTARLMVETGRDPPLRQLRAEAALAEARAAAEQAGAEAGQAERSLAALTGIVDEDLDLEGPVAEGFVLNAARDGEPIAIRIAEAERRVAEARIDVERSTGVADITARAGLRGHKESNDVALVGGISLPLAIRDRNRGGVEAARAELLAAEARAAQARLDSVREARDAQALLSAAEARMRALEGAGLKQAEEAVRVARIGYGAGKFSLLDVLDAEAALNTARTSIIEARRDRARALAALERAQAQ